MANKKELLSRLKPKIKEPIIIDRSTAEAYSNCPFQGFSIINGAEDEAGEAGQIGIEGHKIAERCLKDAFESRYAPEELRTFADDVIQEIAQSRPDIQPKLIQASKYLAEQIAHVPVERILTDGEKPFIEYQIDYEVTKSRDGRPVKITTCIDLAFSFREDSIHVWDWKFGFRKYMKADAETEYQPCHISYILFQMFPSVENIHFWYIMPRYGIKAYACYRRHDEIPSMPHLTVEDMLLYRIDSVIQLILEKNKEAWPEEKKCLWCPVISECPHKAKALTGIPTDPKELVDVMVVLNAWIKKHEKAATELWKKDGVLKGSKHTWEWKPSRIKPRLCEIKEESGDEDAAS